jgi:probable HAF family extracellular repeat protein
MNNQSRRILGLVAVGAALAGFVVAGTWTSPHADAKGSSGPTLRYQLVSLGTLGGAESHPMGMNDHGDVVGWSYLPDGSVAPFVWFYATGMMHNLNEFVDPASGWTVGEANDINNYGQICGSGGKAGVSGAIRFDPPAVGAQYGKLTFVSSNDSDAFGINDHGDVVGPDYAASPNGTAFVYTDELGSHLVTGTNDAGLGCSISNRETATDPASAYIASTNAGAIERAVRYTPGVGVVDLGTLGKGFPNSWVPLGNAVNDLGQVTGTSDAGGGTQAFRYTNGIGMKSLGSGTSAGMGINNNGDVVGSGSVPFIYMDGFGAVDLRSLTTNIPANMTGLTVRAINNGREIVGTYNNVACILEVTHP